MNKSLSLVIGVVLGLTLGLFVLAPLSYAVEFDPNNPSTSGVQAETVCINGVACQNGTCSSYNTSPLVKVHRFDILFNRSVQGATVVIEECVRSGGNVLCIPAPRGPASATEAYKPGALRNYLADTGTDTEKKSSIQTNIDDYVRGFLFLCQAANTDWVEAGCNNTQADFDRVKALLNTSPITSFLRNKNYNFLGLYQAEGTSGLTPVTEYKTSIARAERFEWSDESTGFDRFFRATAFYNLPEGTTGGEGSNQVATLGFLGGDDMACPTTTADGGDPYGQVFDSETLEPIEGATVVLYMKIGSEYEIVNTSGPEETTDPLNPGWRQKYQIDYPYFVNPYITDALGHFSFIVAKNNKYKLLVLKDGATAPPKLTDDPTESVFSGISTMDPEGYVLGKQVKLSREGKEYSLYPINALPSELNDRQMYPVKASGGVVEIPEVHFIDKDQERDIATKDVTPELPKKLYSSGSQDILGNLVIVGRTNKPFGVVEGKKVSDSSVVATTVADIEGKFTLVVPAAQLAAGDVINAVAKSPDPSLFSTKLTSLPLQIVQGIVDKVLGVFGMFEKDVNAQTTVNEDSVTYVYRPRYIEGYAYDANGVVMKNAKVAIYDATGVVPRYMTQTDEEGVFKITSENIPSTSYTLRYTPEEGGQSVVVQPEKFVQQNATYIKTNNLNLSQTQYGTAASEEISKAPPVVISGVAVMQLPTDVPALPNPTIANEVGPTAPPAQPVSTQLLMLVALLLLLIVGAGLLVVYYMKKKQEPHMYE